jgi:integrase
MKDQLVQRNVAALVKPPRVVGKEVQPLSLQEARRFLESIKGDRLEALFTVAVSLGLRQGEALGLRWRDVDFEAGTIRIRYALQRLRTRKDASNATSSDSAGFHLVEPKTKQSRRTIAVPSATLSSLAQHQRSQLEERTLAGSAWRDPELTCDGQRVPVDDLLFVTPFGGPFDAPIITRRFQALLTLAGVGHHRFHDLRHTAATLLAVQGVHPRAIQAALGWENLAMLNRYTHFVEEQRQAVATAMESILNPLAVKVAVKTAETKVS